MNKHIKYFIILIFIFLVENCFKFDLFDLTPTDLINIPVVEYNTNSKTKNFIIPSFYKDNLIYNLPQSPIIYKQEALLPFPETNFYVYFLDIKDSPKYILSSESSKEFVKQIYENITIKTFSSGVIGNGCLESQYILLQIFQKKDTLKELEPKEPQNRLPAILYPETKDVNPYNIFIIFKDELSNKKEEKLNLKPMSFDSEKAFTQLSKLFCFPDFAGIVLFSNDQVRFLTYNITNKQNNQTIINLENIKSQYRNKIVLIENVFLVNEETSIIEISIRDPDTFKINQKSIYEYSKQGWNLILDQYDFNNNLIYASSDYEFYLGGEEENHLIIKIYNKNLENLSNKRIKFKFKDHYWKEYFINTEGRIFSSKLENQFYTIVEWK